MTINLPFIFATVFGIGQLPLPGVWGSLLGILLAVATQNLNLLIKSIIFSLIFVIGIISSQFLSRALNQSDPKIIIIDEITGSLFPFLFLSATLPNCLLIFLIFRFLDNFKPFPINLLQSKINGGLGIMLDDILAGFFTLIFLTLLV